MSFGIILKEKRNEQKLTIEEIAKVIHIKSSYLRSFEEEKLEEMPNEPFSTGFLKNYINFLGLDEGHLYSLYLEFRKNLDNSENIKVAEDNLDHYTNEALKKVEIKHIFRNNSKKSQSMFKYKYLFFILIVFLLFVIFLWQKILLIKSVSSNSKHINDTLIFKKKDIKYNYVLEFKANEKCWIKLQSDGVLVFQNLVDKFSINKWYANNDFDVTIGNVDNGFMFLNGKMINIKKNSKGKTNRLGLNKNTTAYWVLEGEDIK